ncbi:hypothetical protein ACJRO7_013415 [Eucalyptus globulus]|uniref:Transmembrane protein n=1 Tax=Eucalyptus globulus TaxID=34317 RepID=A0ABD3KXV3_EUCGL
MDVKRWQLILSLITLALLFQSPASSAHEVQKGYLGKSLSQHRERQESKLMNKDILISFRNRKLISVQVKKVKGVRPRARAKTSAAVQAHQIPSFFVVSLCFLTSIGLFML